MRIPKSFELLGNKIIVSWKKTLDKAKRGPRITLGLADFWKNKLLLSDRLKSTSADVTGAVFFHELAHFLLYYTDEKLAFNEKLVEKLGQLLYQYEKTKC